MFETGLKNDIIIDSLKYTGDLFMAEKNALDEKNAQLTTHG